MRITLFVGRPDLGGGARVISIYAERLQQRGHDVTVIARSLRKATLREKLSHALRGRELPAETVYSPSYFEKKNFQFRYLDSYRAATAADVPDADVVIATWWETAEWVADFPVSKGAKVYFLQHYETFATSADRIDATWRQPMHKVVVAQWLADLARDQFGDVDVSVVPNSVDLQQFNAPPRGKQPQPTVGVMYSTVRFKGCDLSLRAVSLARQKLPNLQLVSFGTAEPVASMPLPPNARYVREPAQAAIRDVYASCDAWLFGSRSEGFGLPLLEAMACRTPVIATPAGAAPELVSGGGGMLVPPEDPPAMAKAIERIAAMSESDWRAMSDKAYATASRYTWDDATDRFEAALFRAVERSRRGGLASVG